MVAMAKAALADAINDSTPARTNEMVRALALRGRWEASSPISLGTQRTGPPGGEASFVSEIVWRPSGDYVERANVTRLMRTHGIGSYDELVNRSQDEVEWFWDAVVKDLGIEFYEPYRQVLDESRGKPWATWFGGGTINLAHNCLDRWARAAPDRTAVLWEGEEGVVRAVTYAELQRMTNRLAHGLRALGVGKGDTVGIFLPMAP